MMMMIALVAAGVALAQPYPSRLQPSGTEVEANAGARNAATEGQRVLIAYGMCVTRRERRSVEAYLAAPMGSDEASRLATRINSYADCLVAGELRFDPPLFRGALYEALYTIDHGARAPADPSAAARVVYMAGDPASLTAMQRDWRALTGFADCVVRAAPAETRQLVLAEATSAQDRGIFRQIQPHLGPCLPQGVQLTFSRPILRGLIAESLYRLASAGPAPATAAR